MQSFQSLSASKQLDGVKGYERTQHDSYHSVKNCGWNNKALDCRRLFINKPTDSGICFTFNPAQELLKAYKLFQPGDEYANGFIKTYGTSVKEWRSFISYNTGLKSGFSITLLSNVTELCASYLYYGGFVATVHDPLIEPLLWMSSGINLSPGWMTNVAMILIKTDRKKTEAYGYCQSQLSLSTFRGTVNYNSRDFYTTDCITQKIILNCACLPYYTPRGNVFFFSDYPTVAFTWNNESYDQIPFCGANVVDPIPLMKCQNEVEKRELRSDRPCVTATPKPCEETQIKTQITSSLYPNSKFIQSLKRQNNGTEEMTLGEFRQNFLSAKFFFNSNKYTLVTETIKMTWIDLMNQVGGAMGMTLGLSIVGVVEILIWAIIRLTKYLFTILFVVRKNGDENIFMYRA